MGLWNMSKKNAAYYHPETGELLAGIKASLLSLDGRFEYPDPVPMEQPVSVLRVGPGGMRQLVQELIRAEMSDLASAMEMETFEEADDFELEDDPLDPLTDYEKVFDPEDNERLAAATGRGAREAAVPSAAPPSSATPSNPTGTPAEAPRQTE